MKKVGIKAIILILFLLHIPLFASEWQKELDAAKALGIKFSSDNKTGLQELIQQKSGQTLSYQVTGESGPDHCKQFTVSVYLNGVAIGSGVGRTKKEAEQAAAGDALGKLK